jgi:8-oxo-dGTP pyrophosphatase MutT (NUDIX family)
VSVLERVATVLKEHRPLILESATRSAAVALLLRERGETLEILVIKRAEKTDDPWSGHMALPGGGWEPGDEGVYATARRETFEEIGVDLNEGRFLGRLDDMGPRSAGRELVVSTIVVALDAEPRVLEEQEVAEAFWIPVNRLVDGHVEIPDFPGSWPAFTYKDRYIIWGLTHRILTQLWALIPA